MILSVSKEGFKKVLGASRGETLWINLHHNGNFDNDFDCIKIIKFVFR
jgi:hypothetical protein